MKNSYDLDRHIEEAVKAIRDNHDKTARIRREINDIRARRIKPIQLPARLEDVRKKLEEDDDEGEE